MRRTQDQDTRSMTSNKPLRRMTERISPSRGSAKRGDSPTLPSGSPPILPSAISPSECELLNRSGDIARKSRRQEAFRSNGESEQSRNTNGGGSFKERIRAMSTSKDKSEDLSEGEMTEFWEDD
uniref:Uncharacterized protein n=1 Tax=Kwoniella bestiolae CBS 10118 TaxID=1296100 RepID=A0A1B9GDD2_9TREE|nr:hypothetical protein I302_00513 [Kwoniella bestiolae CBS 10118]OCF29022.1 hypothetical protein I302_00513 [Kwoniella bestiolae CBS 10118]